jgi:uncharacterized membrane-anchored protein
MGIPTKIMAMPGTSEDVAMIMAFEKEASLIVAVGSHSNLIDFLEKGRKGMASTFLVRLKVGSILVDARGVSKLYRSRPKLKHVAVIAVAALLVVITVVALSPNFQDTLAMWKTELKLRLWHTWVQLKLWER